MNALLDAALKLDRLLRDCERGLSDPDRLLAPLGELSSRALGVGGEVAGVPVYDPDSFSWWGWGHQLRRVVKDWVAAGRVLDRRGLKRLKQQAKPLFAAARAASECLV